MNVQRTPFYNLIRRTGSDAGWEEYFDYIFPDETAAAPNLKILEVAHKWKKQKVTTGPGV